MLIYDTKTEHLSNPLGLDSTNPRFSWKMSGNSRNAIQKTYQILAYSDDTQKNLVWDSGIVASDQSHSVCWEGPSLKSRQRIFWKVKLSVEYLEEQSNTTISDTLESNLVFFEMGLLDTTDWIAHWILPEKTVDIDASKPAPYLRKEFYVKDTVVRARLYQSSHGLYEFWINGHIGTIDKFKPGFTAYQKRVQYQTYDVTSLLSLGKNCWSVALGDGWWRGTIGGQSNNTFGYELSYIGQLELEYKDGSKEVIITDTDFVASTGGLLSSDMMFGDCYDATKEPLMWKECGFDSSNWHHATIAQDDALIKQKLVPSRSVPVREMERFYPLILHTPDGSTVLDFGQNIAGYVSMKLHNCVAGQKVTLIHGEALDESGNFTQKNYAQTEIANSRTTQRIEYIMNGKSEEKYCPMFSIFGFRYVLLKGYNEPIAPEDFQAIAVYSCMEETGTFTCSNRLINQLVHNSIWSQKGNFMDVPTDCPTRERNPYTGDAQVYVGTAINFMDVYSFFEKWMLDYIEEQYPTGKIPNTVPSISAVNHNDAEQHRRDQQILQMEDGPMKDTILSMNSTKDNGSFIDGSSGWADAATIIPYTLFLKYGDTQILKNQYECCKKWVDYIAVEAAKENSLYKELPYYQIQDDAKYVWDTGFHWGEWLEADIDIYADMWGFIGKLIKCPEYLSATMFYYYSSKIVSEMAHVLNEPDDEKKYGNIALRVKEVYNKYFISDDGVILEGRQALHVRALAFQLVNEEKKHSVANYLYQLVKSNNYTLNTGFLSTPYLLPVLAENGYIDAAYRLLEKIDSPSWLKPVSDGATTIPETWNGYETCSSSLNHYSYGAVCNFLFEYVAGIRPIKQTPGYKHFLLQPIVGGSLTEAAAEYESVYGKIYSAWKKQGSSIAYEFTVPVNTTATVKILGDEHDFTIIKQQFNDAVSNGKLICFTIGSGNYNIQTRGAEYGR